ncbi:4-oxalomesaconate tautomerase [compost metagenome]
MATAAVMSGSVAQRVAKMQDGLLQTMSVEHPTGEFSVELSLDPANPQNVLSAALLRTARLIMRGEVMIPPSVWKAE